MKYIYGIITLCLLSVLTFCTGEKETKKELITNTSVPKCLSENGIFNEDSVKYVKGIASDLQKDESKKFFLRALDLLINKQRANESVKLFQESMMYFPDERTYYFLTQAYITLKDPENASKANDMAMRFGYDNYHELIFNDALISAIKFDTTSCLDQLNEAVYNGFLNKDKIVNEKNFDFIRNDERYISLMVNTFNDDEKLKSLLFKRFMKSLPELSLPYIEPIDSVKNHDYNFYINYDFAAFIPGMEDGRFSRDVTNEYLYVGKINLDNQTYALVYKTFFAIADTLNPLKTFVITYDSVGTVIDNEMIGCFCSPSNSQAYTVNVNKTIETTSYNYKWKNNPIEKGYAGNQIESFEMEKPKAIQLDGSGKINRETVVKTKDASSRKGG